MEINAETATWESRESRPSFNTRFREATSRLRSRALQSHAPTSRARVSRDSLGIQNAVSHNHHPTTRANFTAARIPGFAGDPKRGFAQPPPDHARQLHGRAHPRHLLYNSERGRTPALRVHAVHSHLAVTLLPRGSPGRPRISGPTACNHVPTACANIARASREFTPYTHISPSRCVPGSSGPTELRADRAPDSALSHLSRRNSVCQRFSHTTPGSRDLRD